MALIMQIMQTIAQPLSELAVWLEDNFQVEISDTMAKWHELTGMNITVKEDGQVEHDKPASVNVISSSKSPKTKIPRTKDICKHIFLSGKRVGEQCSTKPKDGADYCSAHKSKASASSEKKEKKSDKEKKIDKKKKDKVAEKIDSDFGSDGETPPPKKEKEKEKESKKESKKEKEKESKKTKASKPVDSFDEDSGSEPETRVKPLLKNKNKKTKQAPRNYDTDNEQLDEELELSDN